MSLHLHHGLTDLRNNVLNLLYCRLIFFHDSMTHTMLGCNRTPGDLLWCNTFDTMLGCPQARLTTKLKILQNLAIASASTVFRQAQGILLPVCSNQLQNYAEHVAAALSSTSLFDSLLK